MKWATCNIGASSPYEAGLYFAWGETSGYTAEQVGNEEGKRAFTWNDYEFGPDTALTKYNETDEKTELDSEDDAATKKWGSDWRMPTPQEFSELIFGGNTTRTTDTQNGVYGLLITSRINGNTLFLPLIGYANHGAVTTDYGHYYWSASLYDNEDASSLYYMHYDEIETDYGIYRCYGLPVRPVRSTD